MKTCDMTFQIIIFSQQKKIHSNLQILINFPLGNSQTPYTHLLQIGLITLQSMDRYRITHDQYHAKLYRALYDMQDTAALTDVTLVCDDQKQIHAHKFILCASSSVLKRIIGNFVTNSNSVIYLRGIHEEMEAIINFIYLGETTFSVDRMNEFINVAKNLEVL